MSTNSEPYELLSSTRFDTFLSTLDWNNDGSGPCPFFLLPYHLDRLTTAADQHGWYKIKDSLTYDVLESACRNAIMSCCEPNEAFKIRLVLSKSGTLTASASPAKPLTLDPIAPLSFNPVLGNPSLFGDIFTIYVDSQSTPTSLFTCTKTTKRAAYNDARLRAGLPLTPTSSTMADVLLYNSHGLVTETSIFNIAFYHSPYWVTPATSTGCLPGVMRRWLLENGHIHEATNALLTKEAVQPGDWVLLFNSVQGCRLGRIAESSLDPKKSNRDF